ncbi:MAG: type II toxin-antitoxin system RelE/ParE family toxin [Desulfurivibrio sp.]|nr:type II toxin-antitoxin system RelE/ParE family toxin [Desulfurivibrio sp.]
MKTLPDIRRPTLWNQFDSEAGYGQYSIRINKQWRICFRWQGTDAYEVEIVDYH